MIASWQESYDKSRQCVEKHRHYSADKGLYSQGYGLPRGHVELWEHDCKEGKMPKNWCLWTVVLERTPENPLDSKEMKPVNLKGNQPWIFVGRTDAGAEAPVIWSFDANSRLIGKHLDAGKDWRQKDNRETGDETVGWHHQFNGQTPEDREGQGSQAFCNPWGLKESDRTSRQNNMINSLQIDSILVSYLNLLLSFGLFLLWIY